MAAAAACIFSASSVEAADPAALVVQTAPNSTQTVDHSAWDTLLKTHVKVNPDGLNRVDYAAFKKYDQDKLKAYISALEKIDPRQLNRVEQFAFFANLYNARTIDIVLEHYPVASIKDISLGGGLLAAVTGGPWKAKAVKVAGQDLSLDDIEHKILRPTFKDPRVHYSVNCASVGCPNLQPHALSGATLNDQLDQAARQYVNSPRGVNAGQDGLVISSIYRWFKEDFGGNDAGIVAHLKKYAEGPLAEKLKATGTIASDKYDWSLNDARK